MHSENDRQAPSIPPRVGKPVWYIVPGPNHLPTECAALITYVQDAELGIVDLAVFPPTGGYTPVFSVDFALTKTVGRWTYQEGY